MSMDLGVVISSNTDIEIVSFAYNSVKKEVFAALHGNNEIHVWDAEAGRKLRCHQGHRGCVTGLAFDDSTKILFSVSLDGCIMLWCDRGFLLHTFPIGSPLFSVAVCPARHLLAVGGLKSLYLYNVLTDNILSLEQDARSAFVEKEVNGVVKEEECVNKNETIAILETIAPLFKGPDLSHSDVVHFVNITDCGKIITAGYDGCMCFYEADKPKESFQKVNKAHRAAISSLWFDEDQNVVMTGGFDGAFKIWSLEGRCNEVFDDISDGPVSGVYLASTKEYWVIGKAAQVKIIDSRGLMDITNYVNGTKEIEGESTQPVIFTMLYSPPNEDVLIGATKNKKIFVWKYERNREYRIFKNRSKSAIECLVTIPTSDAVSGMPGTELIAGDSEGSLNSWKKEADKCSDVYKVQMSAVLEPQDSYHVQKVNIPCIAYLPKLLCFVLGGDDGSLIVLTTGTSGDINKTDHKVQETFTEHTDKVTTLAVVSDKNVVSGSYDRALRLWDIDKLRCIQVISEAHKTAIQCVDYSRDTRKLASCAMNHVVKVWNTEPQEELSVLMVLNHRIPTRNDRALSDSTMQHLTTTTGADGDIGFELNKSQSDADLVHDTILHASKDVPEVTQVRWISFRHCWVTTANDNIVRLWDVEGNLLHSFFYKGGAVKHLFIDNLNELILLSTLDNNVSILTLDRPVPISVLQGHADVVTCMGYISGEDLYITGSLDGTLRLWNRPWRSSVKQKMQDSVQQCNQNSRLKQPNSEIPCPFQEPFWLETDYTQLWKTLTLMEEYEGKHTSEWTPDKPLISPQEALPQAPCQLEKLLDDISQRSLDQLLNKSQVKRQKSAFKRSNTFARVTTMRRREPQG